MKGSQMSKLDLEVQEKTLVKVNQIQQDLPDIHDASLNQVDEDLLQAWREVFEEDKVQVLEVCC